MKISMQDVTLHQYRKSYVGAMISAPVPVYNARSNGHRPVASGSIGLIYGLVEKAEIPTTCFGMISRSRCTQS